MVGGGGGGVGSQLNKCLLKNSRHIMPIMIDPTEHDLHVGDDIIVNAGKRNAVQGRWKYTKMVQRLLSEKVGFLT